MISALIFDFDGTIIDTETPWYHAYRDLYEQFGVDLPLETWGQCIGTTFAAFNPHTYLEECANQTIDHEFMKTTTKEKYQSYMTSQGLRPGVLDYLEAAAQSGLKLAIASSSSRKWVYSYLESHRIKHYFDFVITADDVEQVKPSPELYLKALDSLQVSPRQAIAFEDSRNGLSAAKSAGIPCVIVPNDVTRYMDFDGYVHRIESMQDIKLDSLLNEIKNA